MKNKLMRLLLIGLMVSAMLLGCNQKTEEKQASQKDQTTTVTDTDSETESKADPVTIEEQVLIDEAGIKITAQKFVTDGEWGNGVELLVENNTEQEAGIGCKALIVNNCMIDNMLLATVPAGETITETLWLADRFLNVTGIKTVGQVEVKFFVYDKETLTSLITNDFVTIQTSAYADMEPVKAPEGTVLFEDQGVRILGNYSTDDPLYGSAVVLFVENQSDRNLNVLSTDVTVNDTPISSMCSGSVFKDKVSYYRLPIDLEELKGQGITDLNEIGIQFSFMDVDSGLMIAGPVDAVLEL